MSQVTTRIQLAHNILRLCNFDDAARPIVDGIQAAFAPITTSAFESFIAQVGRAYGVEDCTLAKLGTVFSTSARAVLSGVAYDPTFTFDKFVAQFIFAYTPDPEARISFVGEHIGRFRSVVVYLTEVRVGMPTAEITNRTIDMMVRDAIRRELHIILTTFDRVCETVQKVEAIDVDVLNKERRKSVDVIV